MHLNVAMMTRVALMAAATTVAAQIAIPMPPVPFIFQVLAFLGFTGSLGHILGPMDGHLL